MEILVKIWEISEKIPKKFHKFSKIPRIFQNNVNAMLEIIIKILLFLSKFLISCSAIRFYFKQNVFNFPLKTKISSEINWALIPYNKPGEKLAESISDILNNTKENIDVLFLKNHGVVIGGENLEIINKTLNQLTNELKLEKMNLPNSFDFKNEKIKLNNNLELHAVEDFEINNLVHNSILFQRLKTSWCLYPDHIVFLEETPIKKNF